MDMYELHHIRTGLACTSIHSNEDTGLREPGSFLHGVPKRFGSSAEAIAAAGAHPDWRAVAVEASR